MLVRSRRVVIAVYQERSAAEAAVKALHSVGFDMKEISIAGKDWPTGERVSGFLNAAVRVRVFGQLGAFWGGLFGPLSDEGL